MSFACAEANGIGQFATFLILALVCEGVPVHFLLTRWSPVAAWIATGLDCYGIVWAIALARSSRLRPILLDETRLVLRAGFLKQLTIPRDRILGIHRFDGQVLTRKMTILNPPQFVVEFHDPARASIQTAGFAVDEPERFRQALML